MKHLLLTTIAAVVLVGCGQSDHQHSHDDDHSHAEGDHHHAESDIDDHDKDSDGKTDKELKAAEPVAEAAKPEPPTAKAPDITIHKAAEDGNIEAVKQHLAAGVDVNEKAVNWNGFTPLHLAATMKGHKEVVELLIANGADVNAKSESGSTPLHGVFNGEITELLIAKGSNVNARTGVGQTPLLFAVTFGRKETVEILIAKGADVNAKDDAGVTPLDMAKKKPEIAELLRKHGGKTRHE